MKTAPRPPAPEVKPAPTREQVAAAEADKAKKKISLVKEAAKAEKDQQGVYNDLRTSRQGDVARYNRFTRQPGYSGGLVRFGQVA